MSRGKHFTEKEREFVKVHCLDMSISEIANQLGRNYWAIHRLIQGIGCSKNHKFTPDEDFKIRQLYGKYKASYIATVLGIDEIAVYNRVRKLGLSKEKKSR